MRPFPVAVAVAALLLCSAAVPVFAEGAPQQSEEALKPLPGVAMHGQPKYRPDFDHLDYVNPNAPKGGEIHLGESGTFDSLNPFILKGVAAPGVGGLYQTLMGGTADEAFSEYGEIAETIEIPEDRSYVIFNLRKEARWNDGAPITSADVVWTFNTLLKDGHPSFRAYYAHVKKATAETPLRVRFDFDMPGNRELPLIMGQMSILPEHYWKGKTFASTSLEPPLGSGPYRVKSIDPGRRIVYERVKDWWAANLPLEKGMNNFDTIVYDLYRDHTVLLQAFFSGNYDMREENSAKSWAEEYKDRPAVTQGLIRKEEIKNEIPSGMQAFAFNIRRAFFKDTGVREAINYAFDYEWSNKALAYGAYARTKSYFDNSELASSGIPEGRELQLLQKYKDQLPPDLFTKPFALPKTDGSGNVPRENLVRAKQLLAAAGWKMGAAGLLEKDGKPFRFEFLYDNEQFERWLLPFVGNLKKLGIEAKLRFVDTAQYQNRIDGVDFDMALLSFGQSLSPGNEQRNYWDADKADVKGSGNRIGIKSPVVDDLVTQIISAPDRDELIVRTRALDRVLLWGWYVVPNWHIDHFRFAYWDKFGKPKVTPKYGLGAPGTWWYDPAKAAAVAAKAPPPDKK